MAPLNFFPAEFEGLIFAQELLRFGIAGGEDFQGRPCKIATVVFVGHALDALDQITWKRQGLHHPIFRPAVAACAGFLFHVSKCHAPHYTCQGHG